jgi:adenylate cyclase
MGAQSPERRLAAIFAADVVGYSRLMSEREEATLANLHVCLDIFLDYISSHRGRVFGSAGDSVIAEFSSAMEAVRCAVEIQQALAHRNAGVAGEDRMQFRIGISVGDVIVEGNNLMGEGVNIAARLENLAEAGGINISNDVYRQVQGKFAANYKDVGLQNLKNIPEPVRVYRVTNKINEAQSVNPRLRTLGRRHIMSAIVVLVIVSSLFVFINVRQHHQTKSNTIPAEVTAGLISEPPSLAVLPFDNLSHDRNQDYFIDGITEDLITDLSQISSLRVIARNSVFTYKDQAVNIKEVAREHGVSHVLEGSVRKVGNRIRVNAQLIDALTGHHLWAERFDRDLTDVFAVQDEVTDLITSALKLKLSDRE